MDGHGEYSHLERSMLLRSGLDGGISGSGGSNGSHPAAVNDYAGRASTPTTLTLAQYHNRYGLPSPMPGSNLAVMSSLISGTPNSETRKALLIDFQQYWSAQADNFPRYLMTGGLYPTYPPLLPGTAESLSLLGAGVACVAGGASTGTGPSHSQHVAHYQRLLEMQKQACLASMSAATHHTALYGISASALPPFLDHTPFSSHGTTPFSLVKQEPRELSCTEKTAKQGERRAMGFKVDLDLNRGNKETSSSLSSSSQGSTQSTLLKEPKLSPSTSSTFDKRSNNSNATPGTSNGHQNVKKSTGSSLVQRHNSENVRSKCTSPSSRPSYQTSALTSCKGINNSSSSKKIGSKSSVGISKPAKTCTSGQVASIRSSSSMPSPSTASLSETPIVSVPTHAAAPIPLATVQHDGVVLSALASPSSAAASLASTKPVVLKQQADKLNRISIVEKEPIDTGQSVSEARTTTGISSRQIDIAPSFEQNTTNRQLIGEDSRDLNARNSNGNGEVTCDPSEDSKLFSDDSSDIVVDSTENDDFPAVGVSSDLTKSDQDRAIEETIEKVASAAETVTERVRDDAISPNCRKTSTEVTNTPMLSAVSRAETFCIVTCSGPSSGTRTVYAKTQPVPTVTASGCIQMTSSITPQASTSALPYYHTLYSKPQGAKKVHATTFVPEVGIFKGPSIKAMTKSSSSPSSSGASALSPENRCKLDPRSTSNIYSFSPNGHFRPHDSSPSPSLLSPSRDLSSLSAYSSSASPITAHTTTEISSSLDSVSLDSASVRSQSVASFHSVPEVDYSDDTSDDNENGLVIDDEIYDKDQIANNETPEKSQQTDSKHRHMSHTDCQSDSLKTRSADEDGDLPTMKNNTKGGKEECSEADVVSAEDSDKDLVSKTGSKTDECVILDLPLPAIAPRKSMSALESQVSLVPSCVSVKTCCDVAIDYSLPKSSCSGNSTRQSNSSCDLPFRISHLTSTTTNAVESNDVVRHHSQITPIFADIHELEQTPQKRNANLSRALPRSSVTYPSTSRTKLITSPRKPLIRHEVTATTVGKSLLIPSSPHKRLKLNSDQLKLPALTPTSQGALSKVSRRLRLQEDDCVKRCGSAPPASSSCYLKPLKFNATPASESSSEKLQDKLETSNDHFQGNNIPVGIAVAQIRPHPVQQPRETQTSDNLSRDIRHVHTKNTTQTTPALSAPAAAALASSLVVAGRTVNSSPWLQQMPFTLHPAINSSGTTFDPSFPITAPSGFKFAHDSLTGQFFIVPSGEYVEQGGVWSASGFAPSSGAGNTHYQANPNVPTIAIGVPEGREGRQNGEQSNNGKSATPENRPDNIIQDHDVPKDRSGLVRGVETNHIVAQTNLGGNNNSSNAGLGLITATTTATAVVNPATNITAVLQPLLSKVEQPVVESRGCSPIAFEGVSSSLSLLSTLSSLTSKRVTTSTIGVQTCDSLMKRNRKRKSSIPKLLSLDQAIQTSSPELSSLNPLSVQCPDLDSLESMTHPLEVKTNTERTSYNPFTDPQILQAADGLELLSALAEKRTKCSSLDDPKRIFPSPSDSFKSDSASIAAMEDTLSPGDTELKSGQCTPRREVRRDLSPKWSLPKKETHAISAFADFKAPPEVDIPDDSDVRIKLAEVQRQYKEKQKELAKLQIKKSEESKPSKRGPGRPPKKKVHGNKSDDDSSSSPSKTKEHHQPQKKKRPAEELVDRVFRKLPPVIKPSKGSRSIHYVKSKTGPFFRRKSASSSVKRNKGKSKSRHRSSSSQSEDSKHSHDAGNIFANLESFGSDYTERREQTLKHHSHNHRKLLSSSGTISVKAEPCSISSHQESGLGLLAKFALTVSATSLSSANISLPLSSLTTTTLSSAHSTSGNQSSISSFSSNTFSASICSSSIYCSNLYNSCSNMYSMSGASNGSHAPSITFGSLSSLMSSPSSGLISFNSPSLAASTLNSITPSTTSAPTFAPVAVLATSTPSVVISPTSTTSLSVTSASPLFPSPGNHHTSMQESSSGTSNSTVGCSSGSIDCSISSNTTNSSAGSVRDASPFKRRHEEDSDTDTSDTSPNKKRKPGRPRKMNPEKSSGVTETIWAKKSSTIGLLQVSEPSCVQTKDGSSRKLDPIVMKPLFLDEEWTRRRSERIFLNEPSPLSSPALSPSPRGEPVWKLSHFMPKSKKMQDSNKPNKESDKDKTDSAQDHPSSLSVSLTKTSALSPTVSSTVAVKTEGKEIVSPSPAVSWTVPAKTTEISTPKFEDAKIIVKLQHSTSSSSSTTVLSSPEKTTKGSQEKSQSKKKKAKNTKKTEQSPAIPSSSSPSPPALEKKEKRAEEHSKIKLQKAKSLHDLTQRVKKKFSKTGIRKQRDDKLKESRTGKKNRKISTDSYDSDNLPLVSFRENPTTPEPRSCKLQPSDLREGLKVLYLIDGLFHEGTVKALQPPDVYGVLTAGQRGNRPHILCLEEILKWAVLDVRPGNMRFLSEGTRVCAFWSQQFSCLYPGTVAKSSPIYNGKKVIVPVDFDDGDNGRIELDHIRLLPADFPIVEYEPDPLEVLPKRKQRTMSDTSDARRPVDKEPRTSKHSKADEDDCDDDDDGNKTDSDDSGSAGVTVRHEAWRWDGKSTKRPGLKGKAKKIFYKAVSRGKETIKVGDSAVFVSKDRVHCPYIGRIESLWEGWNGQMMVKVTWYYHPEETQSNKKLSDPKNALFESQHEDENDIQTIAHKCQVLPYTQYKKQLSDAAKNGESLNANVFFLAGFYDPTARNIIFYQGVS